MYSYNKKFSLNINLILHINSHTDLLISTNTTTALPAETQSLSEKTLTTNIKVKENSQKSIQSSSLCNLEIKSNSKQNINDLDDTV